jgi:hypothetical protein
MAQSYSETGVSKVNQQTGVQVPELASCYRRLVQLETNYRIKLGLWVSVHESMDGEGYFQVNVSGSGEAYDYVPAGIGVGRARVISAFDHPFASALWSALDQVEQFLDRHAGYLAARPSR